MLKILRVKPWSIKFSLDGRKYIIKDTGDGCDSITTLFSFESDEKGKYTVTPLKSCYGSFYAHRWVDMTKTYAQMDKTAFLQKLCVKGFGEAISVSGDGFIKADKMKRISQRLEEMCDELDAIMKELEAL